MIKHIAQTVSHRLIISAVLFSLVGCLSANTNKTHTIELADFSNATAINAITSRGTDVLPELMTMLQKIYDAGWQRARPGDFYNPEYMLQSSITRIIHATYLDLAPEGTIVSVVTSDNTQFLIPWWHENRERVMNKKFFDLPPHMQVVPVDEDGNANIRALDWTDYYAALGIEWKGYPESGKDVGDRP